MEKYSHFRDKGSGISPFLPIPLEERSNVWLPVYVILFVFRVSLLAFLCLSYLLLLQWLPIGTLGKKAIFWCILGTPGIWWIDLQIDGVRRGSLGAKANKTRLPSPGTVLASSHTSPIDCLYLAAIFDPIFTVSYPNTREVTRVSLFQAMLHALSTPQETPPQGAHLTTVAELVRDNPDACILVFPECTTTNGRGILPLSPSLLTVGPKTKIFPVNLRYSPADVTTPVPGTGLSFLWNLCSKSTNCIRVRIASPLYNSSTGRPLRIGSDYSDSEDRELYEEEDDSDESIVITRMDSNGRSSHGELDEQVTAQGRKVLDQIGESLARLGRVKRVSLGVKDKLRFIKTWTKTRNVW